MLIILLLHGVSTYGQTQWWSNIRVSQELKGRALFGEDSSISIENIIHSDSIFYEPNKTVKNAQLFLAKDSCSLYKSMTLSASFKITNAANANHLFISYTIGDSLKKIQIVLNDIKSLTKLSNLYEPNAELSLPNMNLSFEEWNNMLLYFNQKEIVLIINSKEILRYKMYEKQKGWIHNEDKILLNNFSIGAYGHLQFKKLLIKDEKQTLFEFDTNNK